MLWPQAVIGRHRAKAQSSSHYHKSIKCSGEQLTLTSNTNILSRHWLSFLQSCLPGLCHFTFFCSGLTQRCETNVFKVILNNTVKLEETVLKSKLNGSGWSIHQLNGTGQNRLEENCQWSAVYATHTIRTSLRAIQWKSTYWGCTVWIQYTIHQLKP